MRRFIPDQVYSDEVETAGVLAFLIAQAREPGVVRTGTLVFAVCRKDCGELIGHVGLSPSNGDQEIGYAIAQAHHRQGYATELVRETVRWACAEQGLSRVLGVVADDNLASIGVLEKAGFTLLGRCEGTMHGRTQMVRRYQAGLG